MPAPEVELGKEYTIKSRTVVGGCDKFTILKMGEKTTEYNERLKKNDILKNVRINIIEDYCLGGNRNGREIEGVIKNDKVLILKKDTGIQLSINTMEGSTLASIFEQEGGARRRTLRSKKSSRRSKKSSRRSKKSSRNSKK